MGKLSGFYRKGPARKYVLFRNIMAVCLIGSLLFFVYAVYQVTTNQQDKTYDGRSNVFNGPQIIPTFLPKQSKQFYSNLTIGEAQPFGMVMSDLKKHPASKLLDSISNDVNKNAGAMLYEEVTVVTMYLNIGSFQKGDKFTYFTPKLYSTWMRIFGFVDNPVVAFFDNTEDKEYFENIRRRFDPELKNTKTVLVKREELWAFSLLKKISQIYSMPNYPKHLPNTVNPEYSCAMHAKYEFMQWAVKKNIFNTKFFAWLDIGLFRSEAMSDYIPRIHIWKPPGYNLDQVAYTEVSPRIAEARPHSVVLGNMVWVCGCFFFGAREPMEILTHEYMKATTALLKNWSLMNTDQQILYVLFNSGHPKVQIQTYNPDGRFIEWFHLGYLCKEEGDKLRQIEENKEIQKS